MSRTTLWTWSNDVNFIWYKEALADELLRNNIDLANGQLLALIRGDYTANKTPSIKALELFYKLNGKLVEKKEITTNVSKSKVLQSEVGQTLAELGKRM
ncbi:phBC6A51 family helix-turn-helix protein [Bacillus toyonensis]|uniref:phBC6A51 family helix-turn-helix protein n=1 Tax=Bacillus toyonensis TaxID=155322 RepID=UPI003D65E85F